MQVVRRDPGECPNHHVNPPDWELCGQCGYPIADPDGSSAWFGRHRRVTTIALMMLVLAVGVGLGLLWARTPSRPGSETPMVPGPSLSEWWSAAEGPFTDLQDSLQDAQQALKGLNPDGLLQACQTMHRVAAVELASTLPSPDPLVTTELHAAIEDGHAAAHHCLSVAAGSANHYDGEFVAELDQASRLLNSAYHRITKSLTAG
ncbi:hypothetical protein L2K20_09770 [Mycobacterium sp. MBM]|nr:hypothetical protein [Mycobacterium sp. MBM]